MIEEAQQRLERVLQSFQVGDAICGHVVAAIDNLVRAHQNDQLTRIANALELIALQGQAQFEFATREENQKIGDTIDRLREEMLKQ